MPIGQTRKEWRIWARQKGARGGVRRGDGRGGGFVSSLSHPQSHHHQNPPTMSTEERFAKALKFIQSLPKDAPNKPSNTQLLQFYALFKQISDGKCTTKAPSRMKMIEVHSDALACRRSHSS